MAHPPFPKDFARQARLFRQSRERWKQRCAAKQDEIRALRVRIRDLEASRARWKQTALQKRSLSEATTDCNSPPGTQPGGSPGETAVLNLPSSGRDATPSRLPGHVYPLTTMYFCLLSVVKAHTSYRSALLLGVHLGLATPCVETVRGWLLRLGLYLLRHVPQRRTDWIWIIDHTLQWGTARCLVVLGVSEEQLRGHGFRLGHADVCVLAVEVVEHSDGVVVQQQLVALAQRVGVPRQLVSDHGADLSKGIRLFQQERPEVLDTYDITHKMACLLKGLLENDPAWQAFVRQCGAVGARLRQTVGSFLLPPTLRSKARYMNLETLLCWAQRMQGLVTPSGVTRLAAALQLPVAAAQSWWQETFGWLEGFGPDLEVWGQLWALVCRAEEQVRAGGIHAEAGQQFRASLPAQPTDDKRVQRLTDQIEVFLNAEGKKVPAGRALLGSSEVIESVFGSYKQYVERGVWSEIGSNVLLLPVLLVTLTTELLRRALTAVCGEEVRGWCAEHLGPSRQQRFGQVFGKNKKKVVPPAGGAESKTSAEHQPACRPPPSGKVAA